MSPELVSLAEGGGSVKYISTTPEVTGGGEQDGGGQQLDTPPLPHTPLPGAQNRSRKMGLLTAAKGAR